MRYYTRLFMPIPYLPTTFLTDTKYVYSVSGESSSLETLPSTNDQSQDVGTSMSRPSNISDFPSFEEASSSIPDDQHRMIDNINSLMSEVTSQAFRANFWHTINFSTILAKLVLVSECYRSYNIIFQTAVSSGERRATASTED